MLVPETALSQQWLPVRTGKLFGISGMALVAQQSNTASFLIVHDSKKPGQGRLATITTTGRGQPRYLPLNWPDQSLPTDLEGLTAIPGQSNSSFMASTSAGKVYHLRFDASSKMVRLLKVFDLPHVPQGSELEGFSVQELNNQLLAVWAHRGAGLEAAVVYWGLLNPNTYQITQTESTRLKVPWPVSTNVRHVSDLKVDPAGVLFIAAATDPGDDGPFQSAVYVAGVFDVDDTGVTLRQNSQLVSLSRFDAHKVEGLELVPGEAGGLIVGTDDENRGSAVSWMGR